MIAKQILQHRRQKDKGNRCSFALGALLVLVAFVVVTNSVQPKPNAHPLAAPASAQRVGPLAQTTTLAITQPTPLTRDAGMRNEGAQNAASPSANTNNPNADKANIQQYSYTIKKDDTLSHILEKHASYSVIRKLMDRNIPFGPFNSLTPGRKLIITHQDGIPSQIVYRVSPLKNHIIQRQDDGSYQISEGVIEVEQLEIEAKEIEPIKIEAIKTEQRETAQAEIESLKFESRETYTSVELANLTNQSANNIEQLDDAATQLPTRGASSAPINAEKANADRPNTHRPDNERTYLYTIQSGDTFSHILEKHGSYSVIRKLLDRDIPFGPFNSLAAGRTLSITQRDGITAEIAYQVSPLKSYKIKQQENGSYQISEEVLEIEQLETHATVEITDSLYLSSKRAGLADKLIVAIANILEWDIDFAYDVRKGDHFSVIYYENYIDDKKIGDGPIIALRFVNDDRDYRITRYTDSDGNTDYYFLDGRKVRKAFLRNPLEFSYVSSHFNPRRMHPLLHKVRAHKGVDYAAKHGSPVRASGDGRIFMRRWYNGYGKTVILKHGGGYSTLYAHLSKYAPNQRVGSWVKQGQIIGYVGSTGLSTGPHLHYEFRVNGVHQNPLTIKLPDAKPLAKDELPRFREHIKVTMKKLNLLSEAYIASKHPHRP